MLLTGDCNRIIITNIESMLVILIIIRYYNAAYQHSLQRNTNHITTCKGNEDLKLKF